MSKKSNSNLINAKVADSDEFYTQMSDIEKELNHYLNHFENAVVYCNCDDPACSNFWRFFHLNFNNLGLKKLIATFYDPEKPVYKIEYTGGNDIDFREGIVTELEGNGDFSSPECVETLREADIVVTNPPWSLIRKYVSVLTENNVKFLILANKNIITYKNFFVLFQNNQVWMGYGGANNFVTPSGKTKKINGLARWFTNLDISKRHQPITLTEHFKKERYPIYDNYAAFNIDKVRNIPVDKYYEMSVTKEELSQLQEKGFDITVLNGKTEPFFIRIEKPILGVPISFLEKHCPEQFNIVGMASCHSYFPMGLENEAGYINGKWVYARILIKYI